MAQRVDRGCRVELAFDPDRLALMAELMTDIQRIEISGIATAFIVFIHATN